MTDREAMLKALDALEVLNGAETADGIFIYTTDEIFALRQALAQPVPDVTFIDEGNKQEPVAWMLPDYGDVLSASEADGTGIYNVPLYTAPPKREQKSISTNKQLCAMLRQVHDVLACTALPMKRPWVGLTDDEVFEFLSDGVDGREDINNIEELLRSKNSAL